MTSGFNRFGERLCFVAVGFLIADAAQKWDGPQGLIPVYVAIGAGLVTARWYVVTRRDKRDRERLSSHQAR
jgi:hypothetical protein